MKQTEKERDKEELWGEESTALQTDLRESLLLAGIAELEAHGLAGFSLRRVAAACGVSCAAPYKHFKDKDALIAAILSYIHEKWALLERHICTAYPKGGADRLVELCLADIRFWIGNPHFRSVHMMERDAHAEGWARLGPEAERELALLCAQTGAVHLQIAYTLRSLVYGAILMLEDGTLENTPESFRMLRTTFSETVSRALGEG